MSHHAQYRKETLSHLSSLVPAERSSRDAPADVQPAAQYGLYDLDRLERMILRRIASEYFQLDNQDK